MDEKLEKLRDKLIDRRMGLLTKMHNAEVSERYSDAFMFQQHRRILQTVIDEIEEMS